MVEGNTIFIIGHVENNNFVIRRADSTIEKSYSIKELENLGIKYNIPITLLGCKTGMTSKSSGYLNNILDTEVINNLNNALKSKNYGQFFYSLALPKSPLLIQGDISNTIYLNINAIKLNNKMEKINQYTTLSQINMITHNKTYTKEISSRLIWFIPSWVLNIYFLLYFFSIATFYSGWRLIKKVWVISEYTFNQKLKSIIEHFFRILCYILLLPFYTIFMYIIVPFLYLYKIIEFIYKLIIYIYKTFKFIYKLIIYIYKIL